MDDEARLRGAPGHHDDTETELDCAEQMLGALRELEDAKAKAFYGFTVDLIQDAIYAVKKALHQAIN